MNLHENELLKCRETGKKKNYAAPLQKGMKYLLNIVDEKI